MQINTGIIVAEVHLGILEQIVILVSTLSTISYSLKNTLREAQSCIFQHVQAKKAIKKKVW